MERYDMHTANTVSHARSFLYVTKGKSVKKMCTRSVAHTEVATKRERNIGLKKNPQTSSFHVHLDFSHQDVVHQFAFHRSS